MKSLSSSRREVLVDCFHVYTYYISYLLPGCAVLQHAPAEFYDFRSYYPFSDSLRVDSASSIGLPVPE